jgi:hypothetical protein
LLSPLAHFRYASRSASALGSFSMSRTFRTLALSAALLAASTASAYASVGGANPHPQSIVSSFLALFGF